MAASILLDAAVQEAKSVRVVYLEDSYYFMRGAAGMADMGRVLSEVIQAPNASVYCLFNKFHLDNYFDPAVYKQWTAQEKVAHIKETLTAGCKSIVETCQKQVEDLQNKARSTGQSISGEGELTIDRVLPMISNMISQVNVEELRHNFSYASIVASNFDAGRFGYIDPFIPETVESIRAELFALDPIQKSDISFDSSTSHRVLFNTAFENTLATQITPLLKEVLFGLKYPPSLIREIQSREKAREVELAEDLEKVHSPQYLAALTAKYKDLNLAEVSNAEKNLEGLLKRKTEMEEKIHRIMDGEPVLLRSCKIASRPSAPHYLWANQKVTFDDMPFVKVEEEFDEHTRRESLKFPSKGDITEQHISKHTTIMTVKDMTKPQPQFEANYTSAQKNQKAIQGAANAVIPFLTGCVLGFVAGPAAFAAVPALSLAFTKVNRIFAFNCCGAVHFYVRPRDKEQLSLQSYQKVYEALQVCIQESENDLHKFYESNAAALDEQILLLLSTIRRALQKCPELLAYAHLKNQLWTARFPEPLDSIPQMIARFHQIGELLYPEHSTYHSEALHAFEQISDEINAVISAAVPPTSSSSSSSSSVDTSVSSSAAAAASPSHEVRFHLVSVWRKS